VPEIEGDAVPPRGIPGRMPSPLDPPPHCRFADRCAMAEAACRAAPVPLVAVAPGRTSRCLRWAQVA
jgi:oligopeptide/dipeptide ABC transporter ATP-binding protein